MKTQLWTLMTFFLLSRLALAEGLIDPTQTFVIPQNNQPQDAVTTENANYAQQFGDGGLESSKLKDHLSTSRPEYDKANDSKGREYKAESGEKTSNLGKNIAIATGTSLVATGTAMMGSPIIAVRAAGARLVAKGMLEFAQAAADSGTESKNGAQKNLLLDAKGDLGNQLTVNENAPSPNKVGDIKQKLLTPELQNVLSQQGVNADDFANQVLAGNLTNPDQIVQALGVSGDFSAEDLSKIEEIEGKQLKNVFKSASKLEMDELLVDKNSGTNEQGDSFESGNANSGGVLALASGGESGGVLNLDLGGRGDARGVKAKGNQALKISKVTSGAVGSAALGGDNSTLTEWGGMLSKFQKGKEVRPQPARKALVATPELLKKMGIRKARRGQNIFFIAKRHFSSFNKWRGRSRLASHP